MENLPVNTSKISGWGVDADPQNDPTYPMRDISGDESPGPNWERPEIQPQSVEVLSSVEHNRLPAVFGTSTPPRGLSGVLRRHAFKYSESQWSHWMMLLAADRVDMVEGLLQDLGRGKIPNIPAEMGIRSEIRHNLPGFSKKVVIAGSVLALAYIASQWWSGRRASSQANPSKLS